jgi:hypothetical protein
VCADVNQAAAWSQIAPQLGLRVAMVCEGVMIGWHFNAFRRAVAEPPTGAGDFATVPWLVGERHGVAVMVRVASINPFHQTRPVTEPASLDIDSWSNRKEQVLSPYTMCIAEVRPTLLAGLYLHNQGFDLGTSAPKMTLGDPYADAAFVSHAFDPARVRELFASVDPVGGPLTKRLMEARALANVVIEDNMVGTFDAAIVCDPHVLAARLDAAVALAQDLSQRIERLSERPTDGACKQAWTALAQAQGLELDLRQWSLRGQRLGSAVEITRESRGSGIFTVLRAEFRSLLGAGLFLTREDRQELFFGLHVGRAVPNAKLGYSDFDPQFLTRNFNPPRARWLFSNPSLRRLVHDVSRWPGDFVITDRDILMAAPGDPHPEELARRLDAICAVVDALTPPPQAATPYRT